MRAWQLTSFALLVGCGARTGLDEPRDATIAPDVIAPDVIAPDVVAPDVVAPDVVAPDAPASICGNGVLEPGEACDLGAGNAFTPAFALSQPGEPERAVQPVVRSASAAEFYGYRSASAHTGFEQAGTANLFLYVSAVDNDLALFFIAGRDGDDEALPLQPTSDVEVLFQGVPSAALVAVSDDPGELARRSDGSVRGRWQFVRNTDGGALSRLPWSAPWRVVAEGSYRTGITALRYIDRNGSARPLARTSPVVIEHRVVPAACRPDCRAPRCGDGYLDAGERCDDGNTRSGDGCDETCQRLE